MSLSSTLETIFLVYFLVCMARSGYVRAALHYRQNKIKVINHILYTTSRLDPCKGSCVLRLVQAQVRVSLILSIDSIFYFSIFIFITL